jgi:excisionase family DNA binding protein
MVLVTVQRAAEQTGLSVWTWRAKAYRGEVESVKLGGRLLIPVHEIDRLIEEGRHPRREGGDGR